MTTPDASFLGNGEITPLPRDRTDLALDALLAKLDADQSGLVHTLTHGEGHVQGRACAGAGKTTTMVAAVGALLRGGVAASTIVVTTFTSKAGKELQERLAKVLHPADLAALRVGTFHGLALRALRAAGSPTFSNMTRCMDIPKRAEGIPSTKLLWARILGFGNVAELGNRPALDLNLTELGLSASDYALAADLIRSRNIDIEHPEAATEASRVALPSFWRAWSMYEEAKQCIEAWDFADALSAYRDALQSGRVRDTAAIVIVDETQDNSEVQTTIASLLVRDGGRLVVVGDSRQAIYSWRGACPEFFADFAARFSATVCELPNNYRSGDNIVAVGNSIAAGKDWSIGLPAVAKRGVAGEVAVMGGYADPFAEAEAVAERIARSCQEGARADSFAVLSRTNAALGAFEAELVKARIPCIVIGGVPFFQRKEVLDVLAYAALIQHDSVNQLDRICNKPKRFLGKAFMEAIRNVHVAGANIIDTIKRVAPTLRSARGAGDLARDIERIRAAGWPTAQNVKDHDLKGLGIIQGMLAPPEREEAEADNDVRGLYVAAVGIASTFRSAKELVEFALLCGSTVQSVSESSEDVAQAATGKVTLTTIHKAKGLEWHHVFVSAAENVFPHKRSIKAAVAGDRSRMDEEERLFYVATTRARDALTLTWAEEDVYGREAGPSRFLRHAEAFRTDGEPEGDDDGPRGGRRDTEESVGDVDNDGDRWDDPANGGTGLSAVLPAAHPVMAQALLFPDAPAVQAAHYAAEAEVVQAETALVEGESCVQGLAEARALAAERTAAEPKAVAGEGGRYVDVAASSFEELLSGLRFHEEFFGQRVWVGPVPGVRNAWIKVYSSIPAGEEYAREVGEDSIRVTAVYRKGMDAASGEKAILPKDAYVCRTRGWRGTLLDRIEKACGEIMARPVCPDCGTTTVERQGKFGVFHGCVRYPDCKGIAKRGGAR